MLGNVIYNEPIANIDRGYNFTYNVNVTGDYYLLLWISVDSTGDNLQVKVSCKCLCVFMYYYIVNI